MSKKDTITKDYMRDNAVFADLFNFMLYDGEQVIKPEDLTEMDTTSIALLYGDDSSKPTSVQNYRDLAKRVVVKTDGEMTYLILGIENQSEIHYAMPVKNIRYDANDYGKQVEDIAKMHRRNKDRPDTSAEYLSGFYKTDAVIPIITLTLYFGAEEWDAPRCMHDMISEKIPARVRKYINNYDIHLVAPSELSDEQLNLFRTDLRAVLKYIKYSKDKDKLKQIVQEDASYRNIDRKTADLVNIMTGSKLKYNEREEKIDMCEAIRGMLEDSRQEGRTEEKKMIIRNMYEGGLTAEMISGYTKIPVEEIQKIINNK